MKERDSFCFPFFSARKKSSVVNGFLERGKLIRVLIVFVIIYIFFNTYTNLYTKHRLSGELCYGRQWTECFMKDLK